MSDAHGRIYSHTTTTVRLPDAEQSELATIVLVDLDGGRRVIGRLAEPGAPLIGAKVTAPAGDLNHFRPDEEHA
ncbi:MAG: OB-fold domain-containing protein [Trebonia sp.]